MYTSTYEGFKTASHLVSIASRTMLESGQVLVGIMLPNDEGPLSESIRKSMTDFVSANYVPGKPSRGNLFGFDIFVTGSTAVKPDFAVLFFRKPDKL